VGGKNDVNYTGSIEVSRCLIVSAFKRLEPRVAIRTATLRKLPLHNETMRQ
jgi:hypothetical protein